MKAKFEKKSIRDLVELKKGGMLIANPEYQRGIVWSETQQKKLIDSILRGYPIPIIYLHHVRQEIGGLKREGLEIIDGQQRINAIYNFMEGAFRLFDPKKDATKAKFPKFIQDAVCSWSGLDFTNLADQDKAALAERELTIASIESDSPNEIRDLFIRLQSGLALNSQETRDAWPGGLTEFILRLGGKPEIPRYPGHEFFTKTMRMKPSSDRGRTRQLAAQICLLLIDRGSRARGVFPDINSEAINNLYYSMLDFDAQGEEAKRVYKVFSELRNVFEGSNTPTLRSHDAIHLALLADRLIDEHSPVWRDKIVSAHERFLKLGVASKAGGYSDRYWLEYGQWTRANSDRGDVIMRRHQYYLDQMFDAMGDIPLKDPARIFGETERTILFYRQDKKCGVCGGTINLSEAEAHHLEPHILGGKTRVENGLLVHQECHPRSANAVQSLQQRLAK